MQDVNVHGDKSPKWGGAREGAGRKKTTSKSIALRIPEDVAGILDKVEGSKSAFIIKAIRAYAEDSIP